MTRLSRRAVLAFAALTPVGMARAGDEASAWVEGHRSRARLVDAGGEGGGLALAAVELVLAPGFKTYWRTPGDSGVPPTFDWSASTNVASVEPLWPAPARFEDAGGVSYGYHDGLVLPVRVQARDRGAPVRLAGAVDYGVCKDICIPARAVLALTLSGAGRAPAAVAHALARVPLPQPIGAEGPLSIAAITLQPGGKLKVRVRAPDGAAPELFPEAPENWYLASSPMQEEGSGIAHFIVEVAQRPREATGPVPLRFTLVAGERAIESALSLDAADLPR
jgi:DsbC/DsbD-like thiol-disulfide interchange protein